MVKQDGVTLNEVTLNEAKIFFTNNTVGQVAIFEHLFWSFPFFSSFLQWKSSLRAYKYIKFVQAFAQFHRNRKTFFTHSIKF